jgi:hypothetical protein
MSISVDEIVKEGKLISVDDAIKVLETTEPLDQVEFALDGSDFVKFTLPDGWNEDIKEQPGDFVTDCRIDIDGFEYDLTKEALLTMTSAIGLQKPFVMKTPGSLVEPQLNYWVKNYGVAQAESMNLLARDQFGVAFVPSSKTVFPNIPILNRVLDRAKARFKTDEFFVDHKIAHSLERTALRLIIPSYTKTINSERSTRGDDEWSLGIQITNSLSGHPETRLNVSGYLFAWWCRNGSISTHATSGNYNRRVQGQDYDEVMAWISAASDHIFEDLGLELKDVEALTEIGLTGELNDVVNDVFRQFKIPVPARKHIVSALIDSEDLSGYGLMQAITQAANDPDLTDKVKETTMRVGGVVPGVLSERCPQCHRLHVSD